MKSWPQNNLTNQIFLHLTFLFTATYRLSLWSKWKTMTSSSEITVHWSALLVSPVQGWFFAKPTHSGWLNLKKMMLMWNAWAQRAWELLLVTEAEGGWASPQPPPSPHTRDHSWTPSQSRSLVTCVYTNTQTHNQSSTQIRIENMKIYTKSSPLHWRLGT